MNKQEFIAELERKLVGLPKKEVQDRLGFYSEMIDDRLEEGRLEEDAVRDIGAVDDIVTQIIADIPLIKIVQDKMKRKRRMKAWEIVLLTLGFPIWFSLLAAVFAVGLSVYAAIWSVVVSLWAADLAVAVSAAVGLIPTVYYMSVGNWAGGAFLLGASLVCAGLSIFLFYGCKITTKGMGVLTKKAALGIKRQFVKKENV